MPNTSNLAKLRGNADLTRESPSRNKNNESNEFKNFGIGQYVVYASHGVGKIVDVEDKIVIGKSMRLFVICFERDKMILRVPITRVAIASMRKLVGEKDIEKMYQVLAAKVRTRRTMWVKRAQEYEAKINSGNLINIAEVLRELFKPNKAQGQSYSEKKLYEMARDRIVSEISIVCDMTEHEAIQSIETAMQGLKTLDC